MNIAIAKIFTFQGMVDTLGMHALRSKRVSVFQPSFS